LPLARKISFYLFSLGSHGHQDADISGFSMTSKTRLAIIFSAATTTIKVMVRKSNVFPVSKPKTENG